MIDRTLINAASLKQVSKDEKPHKSHSFGRKTSTVVACASEDRFGSVRSCKHCDATEVWAGGPGTHYLDQRATKACRKRSKRSSR